MEGSSEEEEEEENREKFKSVAVTSQELFPAEKQQESRSHSSSHQRTNSDVLARRLQQWMDSHYDFTGSTESNSSSPDSGAGNTEASSGILLTSSSLHPVTLSPSPPITPCNRSHSSSSSSEDEESEKRKLLEAVVDPTKLHTPT